MIDRYKNPTDNKTFNMLVDLFLSGETGSPFWKWKSGASLRRSFWQGYGDLPIFPARIPNRNSINYPAYMAGKYCKAKGE